MSHHLRPGSTPNLGSAAWMRQDNASNTPCGHGGSRHVARSSLPMLMLMEPLQLRINSDGPLIVGSNYQRDFGSKECAAWFSANQYLLESLD